MSPLELLNEMEAQIQRKDWLCPLAERIDLEASRVVIPLVYKWMEELAHELDVTLYEYTFRLLAEAANKRKGKFVQKHGIYGEAHRLRLACIKDLKGRV